MSALNSSVLACRDTEQSSSTRLKNTSFHCILCITYHFSDFLLPFIQSSFSSGLEEPSCSSLSTNATCIFKPRTHFPESDWVSTLDTFAHEVGQRIHQPLRLGVVCAFHWTLKADTFPPISLPTLSPCRMADRTAFPYTVSSNLPYSSVSFVSCRLYFACKLLSSTFITDQRSPIWRCCYCPGPLWLMENHRSAAPTSFRSLLEM